MSAVTDALPLPDLYYEPSASRYWRQDSCCKWMQVDKEMAKKFLMSQGLSGKADDGGLSVADQCILRVQSEQNVAYAASLAGHQGGIYTMDHQRILVTDSPRLIEPVSGAWPVLAGLLDGMFNDPGHDQRPYLYGWLKVALAAMRARRWAAGQVLAMAGPVRAGKSLLQLLITELLGGRSAYPYEYMTGETTFNADLFRGEHLMVDDQAESTDIRSRRHFAGHIKQVAVTKQHRCHPKYGMPMTLQPFWRMTISLNDEPERLMVLPPLDEDVADKLMLLRAASHPMPMPTGTSDEQEAFWQRMLGELPAFVDYLARWEIPAALGSSRFGITTYHHPELVQQLRETTPESRLIELVDGVLFSALGQTPWQGTASELTSILTSDHRYGAQARDLLKSAQTCGTYLARLEQNPTGSRISSQRRDDHRSYTILPPESPEPGEQVSYSNARERVIGCNVPLAQTRELVTQPPSSGLLPGLPPRPPALEPSSVDPTHQPDVPGVPSGTNPELN